MHSGRSQRARQVQRPRLAPPCSAAAHLHAERGAQEAHGGGDQPALASAQQLQDLQERWGWRAGPGRWGSEGRARGSWASDRGREQHCGTPLGPLDPLLPPLPPCGEARSAWERQQCGPCSRPTALSGATAHARPTAHLFNHVVSEDVVLGAVGVGDHAEAEEVDQQADCGRGRGQRGGGGASMGVTPPSSSRGGSSQACAAACCACFHARALAANLGPTSQAGMTA